MLRHNLIEIIEEQFSLDTFCREGVPPCFNFVLPYILVYTYPLSSFRQTEGVDGIISRTHTLSIFRDNIPFRWDVIEHRLRARAA